MLKFLDTIFFFKTKEVYSIFFLLIFLAVKKERLRKKKQISTKKIP